MSFFRVWLGMVVVLVGVSMVWAQEGAETMAETAEPEVKQEPVRVTAMTFNIRYGTANDGEHAWPKRREAVVGMIHRHDPDVLGVQEALAFQVEELKEALPEYAFWGVGRDDGALKGEFSGIFYKRDRFAMEDGGHLWLSTTPAVPGSVGWDASMTRMASWVYLSDRFSEEAVVVVNAHFDHRGALSRLESAKLIRNRLIEVPFGVGVVVMGDFNAEEGSQPYQALVVDEHRFVKPLVDAYRSVYPERGETEGTYNGFRADNSRRGGRIDWVLHNDVLRAEACVIDRELVEEVLASDHDPVVAELVFAE